MSARNNSPAISNPPILCFVTDRGSLSRAGSFGASSALIEKLAEMASAGVDWIQIREKDSSARELTKLTRAALRTAAEQRVADRTATRILINDRLDVALAEQADGVHLGETSLPADEARHLIETRPQMPQALSSAPTQPAPKNFLVGVSCHSMDGAQAAVNAGASYIFFGPIFATPSKSSFGNPQGLGRLTEICRAISIPVLAIGGITLENAAACFESGAAGIAAIRLFQDSPDPTTTIATLRNRAR
jgi:thiamine-phosphate pyrophosphorylase